MDNKNIKGNYKNSGKSEERKSRKLSVSKNKSKNKTKTIEDDYKERHLKFNKKENLEKHNINIYKALKNKNLFQSEYSRKIQKNKNQMQKLGLFVGFKKENTNRKSNFSIDKELKGNKKNKENVEEKLLKEIIKKGDKVTREEKQKRFKYLFNLYGKCKNSGSKEDIEKLSIYLFNIEEKDRKLIISKLYKNFPKSEGLYQKLLELISNQSNNIKTNNKKEYKKLTSDLKNNKQNEKVGTLKKSLNSNNNVKLIFTQESTKNNGGFNSSILNNNKTSENSEIKKIIPFKLNAGILNYENNQKEINPFGDPLSLKRFYKEKTAQ